MTISSTLPVTSTAALPEASTLSHAELQNLLLQAAQRNGYVITLCAALSVLSSFLYDFRLAILLPVLIAGVLTGIIALHIRVGSVRLGQRLLALVVTLLFVYLSVISLTITTVVVALPLLAYIFFTDESFVWRSLQTAVVGLVIALIYLRFWPDTHIGLTGAGAQIESLTDCILCAAFTGVFIRMHSKFMRLAIESAKRKREVVTLRVAEAAATHLALEAKRQDLAAVAERYRTALATERQLTAEIHARRERLKQFTYAASHDLKEPIRTVRSFLQVVRKRLPTETITTLELDGAFDRISGQTEAMHLVLERLLEFSRVGRGAEPGCRSPLGHALQTALTGLPFRVGEASHIATANQCTGTLQLFLQEDSSSSRSVEIGDLDRFEAVLAEADLTQIWREILENAVRFRKFGQACHCEITVRPNVGEYHEIDIQDEGLGIAQADLERVFTIFERLHPRGTYPGAGMGLSIVRKALKSNGGCVQIESELGVGTVVRMKVPVANG